MQLEPRTCTKPRPIHPILKYASESRQPAAWAAYMRAYRACEEYGIHLRCWRAFKIWNMFDSHERSDQTFFMRVVLCLWLAALVAADHPPIHNCQAELILHDSVVTASEREWLGTPPEHAELDSNVCNLEHLTLDQWRSFSGDFPVIIPSMGNEKFTSIVSRSKILGISFYPCIGYWCNQRLLAIQMWSWALPTHTRTRSGQENSGITWPRILFLGSSRISLESHFTNLGTIMSVTTTHMWKR